ncbi:MAG: MarR family transcriptional regulator [Acidobacteriota bacterium]|nr:MarR family transcriptional regulator [Acidobacteriota bacterium]
MSREIESTGARVWVVLARAYEAMANYVEQRVAAEGLCLSDFEVLELLLHKGPMTMSAIGEKVLLANASMTSVIDRLDGRGFVARKNDKKDRRVRMVELTTRGHGFISELYPRHVKDLESVMQILDKAERAQLRALLKKLGLAAQAAVPLSETRSRPGG